MDTTSITLIQRLQRSSDGLAWQRLVDLYTPLVYHWAHRIGLPKAEASDLVQDVFVVLVERLPAFQHRGSGSFRGWLRTVTWNKCRDAFRRARTRADLPLLESSETPDDIVELSEQEHREMLARRALELMQTEFELSTWKACWEVVVSGRAAAEIASELGITINAVYLAKSRVLRRLREEFADLLE